MARYNMVVGSKLDKDITLMAKKLGAPRSEVLRRALTLFIHAVRAKKVTLVNNDGTEVDVLLV